MKTTTLHKRGHSIAMTLPVSIRRALGWKLGDIVTLELQEDQTVLVKGLRDQIELRKQTENQSAGALTKINKHVRLPRD